MYVYNAQTMKQMIDIPTYGIPYNIRTEDKQKTQIGACLNRMIEHRLMIPFCLRSIV